MHACIHTSQYNQISQLVIFELQWGDVKDKRVRFTRGVIFWTEYYKDLFERGSGREVKPWYARASMDQFMRAQKEYFFTCFLTVGAEMRAETLACEPDEAREAAADASVAVEGTSATVVAVERHPCLELINRIDQTLSRQQQALEAARLGSRQ